MFSELRNKLILAGSLLAVFIITLVFSYGPGYGVSFLAFLGNSASTSPEMSPSDIVTPMVTLKKMVTLNSVTTATSVSPTPSLSVFDDNTGNIYSSIMGQNVSVSPIPSEAPLVSPSPTTTTTLRLMTPSPTATPIYVSPQSAKININTADLSELDKIPGVGQAYARNIIDYRTINGPFQKIEDIIKVKGIGDKTFQKMKDQITVGP